MTKIIHQIFLKISDKTMADYDYDKNSQEWRKWCKANGYRYMLHNEASISNVMTSKDKEMRARVKREGRVPFINIDWGKLIVLNHYGGAYIDLDVLPTPKSKIYLERPPPIISSWRNKRGDPICNNQVLVFNKGTARSVLDFAYKQYEQKAKMRIYEERKIRFLFQVAGPRMVCKWARENGIKYQKDFHRYFIDKVTTSWLKS